MSELRDKSAYRIAVGAIGLALIVVLVGLCVIVAVGEGKEIPSELWTVTTALGGGLLGLLAPAPTPTSAGKEEARQAKRPWWERVGLILVKDFWANRTVVVLLAVFVVAVCNASHSPEFRTLAAASGAALIGLLAPHPDKEASGK